MTSLENFTASAKKVAEIDYKAIQLSGIALEVKLEDQKRVCDDLGLVICATHGGSDMIINDPQAAVERLNILDTKLKAYPWAGDLDLTKVEMVEELIRGLS